MTVAGRAGALPHAGNRRGGPAATIALVGAACAAIGAAAADPSAAASAAARSWGPFVLVAGLLLIGRVAAAEGVFAFVGDRLALAVPGSGAALLAALLLLVAAVTVVLNLDTAVVFLTPILLHAARRRRLDPLPFAYGAVFMCNAASLLLPGSNLTNLLVLAGGSGSGAHFAASMAGPWVAAVVTTGVLVWLAHRRSLGPRSAGGREPAPAPGILGWVGIAGAGGLVLALGDPAVPVAVLAVGLSAVEVLRGALPRRGALRAASPGMLLGVFGIAVALGTLARAWGVPSAFMGHATRWQAVAAGAVGSVALNNLPATLLLTARAVAHPRALLLGLDVGPNLAITGSLSAILWMRVSRREGFRPSAARYTLLGLAIVPVALAAGLGAMSLTGGGA